MKRREFLAAMAGTTALRPAQKQSIAFRHELSQDAIDIDLLDEGEWSVAPVGMDRILAEMVADGDLALEEI